MTAGGSSTGKDAVVGDTPVSGADISISNAAVTEGNSGTTAATFNVTLASPAAQTVTVQYATANGTATQPADYTQKSGTVTFTPGDTSEQVTVDVKGDTVDEPNETFDVNLSSGVNATIADGNGVGTINDDDGAPAISINDTSVNEGNSGTSAATFNVTLSNPSGQQVTVDYATADGTATQPADYAQKSTTTLTFAPGDTTKQVTVDAKGDVLDEANETFDVNLTNPSNASIADNKGVGTINDDDATPSLSINDQTVTEGNSGTTANFTVTLGAVSGREVTVQYATANGTATQPSDYTQKSGTLTFAAGETTKTVSVDVNGDTDHEPNETFDVNLTNPSNASIADNKGVGTITNDDPDVTAPNTFITSGPSGDTDSTSAALTFASNESGSTFECGKITGSGEVTSFSSCSSPSTFTRARPGHAQVRGQGD